MVTEDSIRRKPWDDSGYKKIHDWEKRIKSVLDEILDVIEKGESIGYYDGLIDLDTNAVLIHLAHDKYVDINNNKQGYDSNPKLKHTFTEIIEQNRGGYGKEEFARIMRLLR